MTAEIETRGRNPLPKWKQKGSLTCRIDELLITRMKIICFRRSLASKGEWFSQGDLVSEIIHGTKMPAEPSPDAVKAFDEAFPSGRDEGDETKFKKSAPSKVMFNCMISPDDAKRLKLICYRLGVKRGRPLSEAGFLSEGIVEAEMPPKPSPAQIAAYLELRPKAKGKVEKLAALETPRL